MVTGPIMIPGNEESCATPAGIHLSIIPSLEALTDPSRTAIRSHSCPACSGPMILTWVRPARVGFELHTFEGVNCDHVDKVLAETKSMNWASSSGLRAPN